MSQPRGLFNWDDVEFGRPFQCRRCRALLAISEDFFTRDIRMGGGIFQNVRRLREDGPDLQREAFTHTVVDVYCHDCGTTLGWRCVEIGEQHRYLRPDRFLLYLEKLVIGDVPDSLVAATLQPVNTPPPTQLRPENERLAPPFPKSSAAPHVKRFHRIGSREAAADSSTISREEDEAIKNNSPTLQDRYEALDVHAPKRRKIAQDSQSSC